MTRDVTPRWKEPRPPKEKRRLRPVGARKRRTLAAERRFAEVLFTRSKGRCEVTSPACPPGMHVGHHPHHIWPSDRDRNVHDPDRGLWVCHVAHRWIHANPVTARSLGWIAFDGDEIGPTR